MNRFAVGLVMCLVGSLASDGHSAEVVEFFGYDDCIRLKNDSTVVTLCPAAGGRVLEYSLDGKNCLYLDESEKGFVYEEGKRSMMSGGRFDIGPEMIIPPRPQLWMGRWKGEITGERSARMTSVEDKPTGVQLIRDFVLSDSGTELKCSQTIKNVSDEQKQWCHWSRTFALGNGICVIPLSKTTRFPKHYVMYEGRKINFMAEDPNIQRKGDYLLVTDVPKQPKLGMDSKVGWFAYLMRNDVMFVKRYQTFPNRVYNEAAGLTISIWYPKENTVEIEPIGPRESLQPGESATFTETWTLKPFSFPSDVAALDLSEVAAASK